MIGIDSIRVRILDNDSDPVDPPVDPPPPTDPGTIPGLVARWQLNETGSTLFDTSGLGSNGTPYNFQGTYGDWECGSDSWYRQSAQLELRWRRRLYRVRRRSRSDLNTGGFTQSMWIRSESTDFDAHGVLGNFDVTYPSIFVTEQNKILAGFWDGTNWNSFTTGSVLTVGEWNHVVVSFNGTTYKAFVNGQEVFATNQYAGTSAIPVNNVEIGRVGTYQFDGQIDEVLIYNRGLTDSEAISLYRAQPGLDQVGSFGNVIQFPNIRSPRQCCPMASSSPGLRGIGSSSWKVQNRPIPRSSIQ